MKRLYLFIILLGITYPFFAGNKQDSLQLVLSKFIDNKKIYDGDKEKKISEIRQNLNIKGIKVEQRYDINHKLYSEFKTYQSDSAIFYINQNINIANALRDRNRIVEAKNALSLLYSLTGNFPESERILNSIDTKDLSRLPESYLADYYNARREFYSLYALANEKIKESYLAKSKSYRDSLLKVSKPDSTLYILLNAEKLIDNNEYNEAKKTLLSFSENSQAPDSDKSEAAVLLAKIYNKQDSLELQKKYLAISAMYNIKNSNKINTALYSLSQILYKTSDTGTAYKYFKIWFDDIIFYNPDFKASDLNQLFNILSVDNKTKNNTKNNDFHLFLYAVFAGVLLILLFIFGIRQRILFIRMRNKYNTTNKELKKEKSDLKKIYVQLRDMDVAVADADFRLKEANLIKISYLNQYIKFGTDYIDKLDSYRRTVDKFVSEHSGENSGKILKPSRFLERELKELHTNFDETFLQVYPTFIESFNALFPEEEKQKPKPDELLNAELRICALLRLGITDSSKIADFLRYSITTIYTYRSKLKSKSLYKDTFEEQIMKIKPNIPETNN